MSDWLNDDSDGYLGLDDPAMPDAAPAPPTQPTQASATDDWLGDGASSGDSAQDDWLGGSTSAAPVATMPTAGQQIDHGGVMDDQGSWFSGDNGGSSMPATDPYAAAPAPAMPAATPLAASAGGEWSVSSPVLEQVHPGQRAMGGSRGELSELVLDVEVQVEVGLGNAALTVEEFLEMGRGSVVELDTPVDAPIELKVRGKLIARGQLVSIGGSYGMRIVEMVNEEG